MGRWLLPRGELTRDQLSTLLLVYVANAADIMGKLSVESLSENLFELICTGCRLIEQRTIFKLEGIVFENLNILDLQCTRSGSLTFYRCARKIRASSDTIRLAVVF